MPSGRQSYDNQQQGHGMMAKVGMGMPNGIPAVPNITNIPNQQNSPHNAGGNYSPHRGGGMPLSRPQLPMTGPISMEQMQQKMLQESNGELNTQEGGMHGMGRNMVENVGGFSMGGNASSGMRGNHEPLSRNNNAPQAGRHSNSGSWLGQEFEHDEQAKEFKPGMQRMPDEPSFAEGPNANLDSNLGMNVVPWGMPPPRWGNPGGGADGAASNLNASRHQQPASPRQQHRQPGGSGRYMPPPSAGVAAAGNQQPVTNMVPWTSSQAMFTLQQQDVKPGPSGRSMSGLLCQLPDADEATLMSTDMNIASDLNLASEEILRHVPLPDDAAAAGNTAWL